jgi:hypothetical protein
MMATAAASQHSTASWNGQSRRMMSIGPRRVPLIESMAKRLTP